MIHGSVCATLWRVAELEPARTPMMLPASPGLQGPGVLGSSLWFGRDI